MVERKLFILESYYQRGSNEQKWRIINSEGLSWREDIDQYTFVKPSICRIGVVVEVTRVQSLLQSSGDTWDFLGVLSKGPKLDILKNDGERYRKAILEKVSSQQHLCSNCGMPCTHNPPPQRVRSADESSVHINTVQKARVP
ncbi:hypothetical protein G647_04993 [Cladophialophora carrionii CBS 160.54]|uniref:Uncharacterized protein n=1 Tax=Cladophialophora carrionii CBS 160.54 TaxID=1279043 RepID=V9D932_9EURO|nr:uncharacterized protein G647_04993 [Cladophialophora carrionii CBS 160.54]ETI23196.1 hypothetical protein G647_04993 [Cladophialophora carrionii CBS 160.54]